MIGHIKVAIEAHAGRFCPSLQLRHQGIAPHFTATGETQPHHPFHLSGQALDLGFGIALARHHGGTRLFARFGHHRILFDVQSHGRRLFINDGGV